MSAAQRALLRLVPSVRVGLAVAVGAGGVATLLLIAQTALLSRIVGSVLLHHRAPVGALMPLLLATAGIMLCRSVLLTVQQYAANRAAITVKATVRQRLVAHLMHLGPAYATGERTADLVTAAGEGTDRIEPYVSRYLPHTVLAVVTPVLLVLAILPVDPLSAALLIFTVPVIVVLMILIGTFTRDHVQAQWDALGKLSAAFLDVIQGLPTLILLDRTESERRRVAAITERFRDRTLSVLKVAFLSGAVLELMTAAGIGLIATVLGVRLLDGGIPFDHAFFVFLLTPEFYRPLRDLGAHRHAVMEGGAAAERVVAILEAPAVDGRTGMEPAVLSRLDVPRRHPIAPFDVEVRDVTYRYPGRDHPALDALSLTLPAGSCTALVGRSGSGKSTLLNLLFRAVDPEDGEILAGGCPISAQPVEVWRDRVAVVSQRPHLFRGTLRDAIRLARPHAGDAEVMRAADLAGCTQFIADLPRGLDTILGERGEGLSAGQRQRIAIARAFLKDAPLLLLDEPTSALDPESEKHIRDALNLLMRDRTVLIVAHRLNTVRAAGRVAVLEGGRLVELGTPEELRRRGGTYASLVAAGQVVPV